MTQRHEKPAHDDAAERQAQVDEIVRRYLREHGERTEATDRELVARYPELQPHLGEALRRLQLIDQARRSAETSPRLDETIQYDPSGIDNSASLSDLRCPHCREPVAGSSVEADQRIRCAACQRSFYVTDAATCPQLVGGRFELIRCVGCGGFGAVWLARDRELHREVAIKVPRQRQLDERELEDFLKEARIAAQLQHPYIVPVHEVNRDRDNLYIVSDYIHGRPLNVWIKENPPTPREAARLLHRIAVAIEHAHGKGVVHRDLKPANILIDEQQTPHITDFGLAKRIVEDVTLSLDGRILGTPAYMSPEQAKGESAATDARSDVYSLGVILFEMLTQELPFRGQAIMLIHQVVHSEPPAPRTLNANVPVDLQTICLKCLHKSPERRYQTASNLAADLQRYLDDEPILARPMGRLEKSWRWSRKNFVLATSAGLILALVFTLLGTGWLAYFALHGRQELVRSQEQEELIRQVFLQTGDYREYRRILERTAADPQLCALLDQFHQDRALSALRRALSAARENEVDSPAWRKLQQQLVDHPVRQQLQSWLVGHATDTGLPVFSWFVLDASGLQIARQPTDAAFGRDYSWRTYFHGGTRDYQHRRDYLRNAPADQRRIRATYLSRALFTNVTHRHVVVISTPVRVEGRFSGVIAIMLELDLSSDE